MGKRTFVFLLVLAFFTAAAILPFELGLFVGWGLLRWESAVGGFPYPVPTGWGGVVFCVLGTIILLSLPWLWSWLRKLWDLTDS